MHEVLVNKNVDSNLISFSYSDEYLTDDWGYCESSPYHDPKTYKFDTEQGYQGYSGIAGYGWVKLELLSYIPAAQADFEIVALITCSANDSFQVNFLLNNLDSLHTYEYRTCGDSTWTLITSFLNDSTGLVQQEGIANLGAASNACVEFRSSFDPNNIQTYQQDNITCCCSVLTVLQNDTVAGSINQAIIIDVLANDFVEANEGEIISFTQGSNGGQVTLNSDNTFTYVSEIFYCGVDTFTYTVADTEGNQQTASVFVHLDCSFPQDNIIAEIICETNNSTITVLFFVIDPSQHNQYRVCGDSTWTTVSIDEDGFVLPIFYEGVISFGSGTDYCMEFSHSSTPENITSLQEDHVTCCCSIPDGSVQARVLLEGAYDTDAYWMKTTLQENGLLPTTQPFNVAPYYYEGTEYINEEILANNFVIVDWVLVEIRTGEPNLMTKNTEVIATQAGLLLKEGLIIGTDFVPLHFDNLEMGEQYHICIRHRNHLDIISAQAAIYGGGLYYDFTSDVSQAFGTSQQVLLSTGEAAMFTGDYTQDGVIQNTDYDAWINDPAQLNVYSPLDGTLDGVVQQTDSDAWLPNRAKLGTVEIQY